MVHSLKLRLLAKFAALNGKGLLPDGVALRLRRTDVHHLMPVRGLESQGQGWPARRALLAPPEASSGAGKFSAGIERTKSSTSLWACSLAIP
jgi:hypothetical protein